MPADISLENAKHQWVPCNACYRPDGAIYVLSVGYNFLNLCPDCLRDLERLIRLEELVEIEDYLTTEEKTWA